jgi:hypothetical protein
MIFEYSTRLPGTTSQYHMLRIWKDGSNVPKVHTNKRLSELQKIEKRMKSEAKLLVR